MRPFIFLLNDFMKITGLNFDTNVNKPIEEYIEQLRNKHEIKWSNYKTFIPPRLVQALKEDKLSCFFGAGLSIPCGLPSWDSLLREHLGINREYLDDDNAKNDPLTQAELAAHKIGSDKVQQLIRKSVSRASKPSLNHYILASLNLPYYITSNYDCLFEKAWDELFPTIKLEKILNDSDLYEHFTDGNISMPIDEDKHYIFKIHGCAEKLNEQLILTRSDYRRHYRSNIFFFKTIIEKLFADYHTLFLGFSHKDPEISRLVEDSIWRWENNKETVSQPNFYSLQFDMTSVTPEIFAARGIVALSPPIVIPRDASIDLRSYCLSHALIDLYAMSDFVNLGEASLDYDIDKYFNETYVEIKNAITLLSNYSEIALNCLKTKASNDNEYIWMTELHSKLGAFAGQGLYLLNAYGVIQHYVLEERLKKTRSEKLLLENSYAERPYFQQSITFRNAFVSDLYKSIYNEIATFSVCLPIVENKIFRGLLFSACQIGQWETPVNKAKEIQENKRTVILVDSNGVCLFPPNKEFLYNKEKFGEEERQGYLYDDLLVLSRKDKLITRIMENLIPLGKDDDVLSLASDLKYYSIVMEVPNSRWKLTVSTRIILDTK